MFSRGIETKEKKKEEKMKSRRAELILKGMRLKGIIDSPLNA